VGSILSDVVKTLSALRLSLSATGACAVATLVAPVWTRAYTTAGFDLGLAQRDARVFDNFTDPEANDNTTPHPNWPGYTGVELAAWKALVEWGSELRGDGSGDPTQPGDVGSGGANFDVTWQGNAPGVGGTMDNVISEISMCGGGVLSMSETGPGGWRIRLCGDFTWDDGPGDPVAGAMDIQGILVHEYGHALGLGHSSVAGSTMFPTVPGSGVPSRSISADDRAGIQAIYGVMSATKPHVDNVLGTSLLTIVGKNFAATGNEVWFTQVRSNPTGEPVKLTGVPSTAGGTAISVTTIAAAGPGDVLVRIPGSGHSALSNAYPWNPGGVAAPADYCVGKVNSQGCTPAISFVGTPSASSPSPFLITASQVLNNKSGLLIYGFAPGDSPWQGARLCSSGTLKRTPLQNSGGNPPPNDCSGTFVFDFNARIQSGIDTNLVIGRSVFAQYYYRDPPSSFGVGTSNGLAFTVGP